MLYLFLLWLFWKYIWEIMKFYVYFESFLNFIMVFKWYRNDKEMLKLIFDKFMIVFNVKYIIFVELFFDKLIFVDK